MTRTLPARLSGYMQALCGYRPTLRVETLTLLVSVYFSLVANGMFWHAMFDGRSWSSAHTWLLAGCLFVAVTALHFLLLSLFVHLQTAKPVLTLLLLGTALAVYFMSQYGVYLDVAMMRNLVQTDVKEARELWSAGLPVAIAIYAVLPIALVWRVRLRKRPMLGCVLVRLGWDTVALAVVVGALLPVYQDLSSVMRNHKEMRYLITPGNYIASLSRVLVGVSQAARQPRRPIGTDATIAARPAGAKPSLLVVVLGETARAENWGLNGYQRQTTPELAALDVINFSQVTACGTSTAVSVPCMFSAVGRRDYDQARIENSESLLHVLDHAGVKTLWRDNQSGCKGVCEGLPLERMDVDLDPRLCDGERCFDEILLDGLEEKIAASNGDLVVVLHQLGNHGPAYYRRYPSEYGRFQPACQDQELRNCAREEIVDAYDNALLYTDHVVAQTIALIERQTSHDAAMIYVSDHGESLGEGGVYLHGLPWLIAPSAQIHVPMVMWLSQSFAAGRGLDGDCLRTRAGQPLTHDSLFHTILGLLNVRTSVYEQELDFSAACRQSV